MVLGSCLFFVKLIMRKNFLVVIIAMILSYALYAIFFSIIIGLNFPLLIFFQGMLLTLIEYVIPFYIFVIVYDIMVNYLIKRNHLFTMFFNQFLSGILLMLLIVIILISITSIITNELSYKDLFNYILFFIFVPVSILVQHGLNNWGRKDLE
jgi:hypothetical protein